MMTNNKKIVAEIRKEQAKKQFYLDEIDALARKVIQLRKKLVTGYPKFIEECLKEKPTKFVNKEKFPTTEEIRSFYLYGGVTKDNIPLYEYGWFDIKELAVIIKVLYSLKRQREYQIVTLANLEMEYTGPEIVDRKIIPYMNFLIGLDKKMSYLEKYNGKYFDYIYDRDILKQFNEERHQNLVSLRQSGSRCDGGLGIYFDVYGELENSFHYENEYDVRCSYAKFSSEYNIFDKNLGKVIRHLDREHRKNIGGLLSFSLDFQDNFIAKALVSIVIYKKKINKLRLDNADYQYIFYELFKEDIDILGAVDKEIPKVLVRK